MLGKWGANKQEFTILVGKETKAGRKGMKNERFYEGTGWAIGAIVTGIFFLLGIIGNGLRSVLKEIKEDHNKNRDELKEHDKRMDTMSERLTSLESSQKIINDSVQSQLKDIKITLERIESKL